MSQFFDVRAAIQQEVEKTVKQIEIYNKQLEKIRTQGQPTPVLKPSFATDVQPDKSGIKGIEKQISKTQAEGLVKVNRLSKSLSEAERIEVMRDARTAMGVSIGRENQIVAEAIVENLAPSYNRTQFAKAAEKVQTPTAEQPEP